MNKPEPEVPATSAEALQKGESAKRATGTFLKSVSKETRRQLCGLFREDLEKPLALEKITMNVRDLIDADGLFFELFVEKIRRDRAAEILRSQGLWFQALGWWFAKLFMWTALFAAVAGVLSFGRVAADPLTWGMLGGTLYYIAIQLLTPWRISQQEKALRTLDATSLQKTRELLEKLEKECT